MSNSQTEISNCNLCGEIVGELIFVGQKISPKCHKCGRMVCINCVGCLKTSRQLGYESNTICRHCSFSEYDFKVYTAPEALPSRDYVEIGPDNFIEKCWVQGNLFIKDESFALLIVIIKKIHPKYFHHGFNNLSRKDTLKLIEIFNELIGSEDKELQAALNLNKHIFETYKRDIVGMMRNICKGLADFCKKSEWITIFGV